MVGTTFGHGHLSLGDRTFGAPSGRRTALARPALDCTYMSSAGQFRIETTLVGTMPLLNLSVYSYGASQQQMVLNKRHWSGKSWENADRPHANGGGGHYKTWNGA